MTASRAWLAPLALAALAFFFAWRASIEGRRLLDAEARAQAPVGGPSIASDQNEPGVPEHPDPTPFANFGVAIERPLFSPTRRPEEEEEASATASVEDGETGELSLRGVMAGAGVGLALISDFDGSGPQWLAVGDEADGWRVLDIAADGVFVQRGARKIRLTLAFPTIIEGGAP